MKMMVSLTDILLLSLMRSSLQSALLYYEVNLVSEFRNE